MTNYDYRSEEEQARRLAGSGSTQAPPLGSDSPQQGMEEARRQAGETMERGREQAGEAMERGREQAGETMERGREQAAEGTERAAAGLRERAREQGGTAGRVGERVAGTMESAAGYLREGDTNALMDEIESYVRRHPMQAVAAAVGTGFFVGRLLR